MYWMDGIWDKIDKKKQRFRLIKAAFISVCHIVISCAMTVYLVSMLYGSIWYRKVTEGVLHTFNFLSRWGSLSLCDRYQSHSSIFSIYFFFLYLSMCLCASALLFVYFFRRQFLSFRIFWNDVAMCSLCRMKSPQHFMKMIWTFGVSWTKILSQIVPNWNI